MRPDYTEKAQRFIPWDTFWGILFLRLKGSHLRTQYGVFYSGHDALLRVKAKLFRRTRDRKGLLEVFKRLPVLDDLVCKSILSGMAATAT